MCTKLVSACEDARVARSICDPTLSGPRSDVI